MFFSREIYFVFKESTSERNFMLAFLYWSLYSSAPFFCCFFVLNLEGTCPMFDNFISILVETQFCRFAKFFVGLVTCFTLLLSNSYCYIRIIVRLFNDDATNLEKSSVTTPHILKRREMHVNNNLLFQSLSF